MQARSLVCGVLLGGAVAWSVGRADVVELGQLDLSKMTAGWGTPIRDASIQNEPLSIAGRRFERGVGTHAGSVMYIALDGRAERFTARVGVDDETEGRGSLRFKVYGDARKLFDSGVMKGRQKAAEMDVPLAGVRQLALLVSDAGDGISYDHADWAEARITYNGATPRAIDRPQEPAELWTPPPGPAPQINGPAVYGARPGRPFVYRIPTTGTRPMRFAVDGLPRTLELDAEQGILTGTTPAKPGRYGMVFHARNEHGQDRKAFTLVVGPTLALTPPMGWNHWYTFYDQPTDQLMRTAADVMVASGMADVGYQYVNLDDCWMVKVGSSDPVIGGPLRNPDGTIRPNGRFPDMKALTDYIHSKGLRAGLYTSPGPRTCAGYAGSWQHERQDALTFAQWGFDFLKYDWCSYGGVATGEGLERFQKPYRLMGRILEEMPRDIVLNLCQYGMAEVWKWGGQVGGHCWRTTGDLGLERGSELPGFYHIGLRNAEHFEYARPGQWNDPDYILIGYVGSARGMDTTARPCGLTPNEQYSYMSMWCLMAAPLFYSGDITRLDAFTLNVLCNPEVIAIDQDVLGRQARIVRRGEEDLVLAKPLADGSLAVGLFDLGPVGGQRLEVTWSELGIEGPRRIRDVWRHRNLGTVDGAWAADVGRHGVSLVRLIPMR